jgi:small-conductance mechanosensitive channel
MELTRVISDIAGWLDRIMRFKLFEIKQTEITLSSVILFLLIIFAFYLISRFLNRGVFRRVLVKTQIDQGLQYTMIRIVHYIIMGIGALVAFQFIGIDLSGLAVIFGLLSVGIGFGLQNITSNFISGLINMRSTTILSLNNIAIIVPNSEFVSSRVTNWSHGDPKIRLDIRVGVSYNSDLETVVKALQEVADEHPGVLKAPEPDVLLDGFGDSSWNMRLRVWISNPKRHYVIRSEINCAIVGKFREYGVEIPFPQRDLHLRSPVPLPLRGGEIEKDEG